MHYSILPAQPHQAADIATLIMLAMNHDCCRYFAGPHHTLDDFHRMMTTLVARDDSQYSYRNTLTAMTARHQLAGICVGYDGKDLRQLREAFISEAATTLGQDFSTMAEETTAGEYYIDSLAVDERFRHQGIAQALLRATIQRHGNDQPVGLLVDQGNPLAERLYARIGFRLVNETSWGGHPMRHLQYPVKCGWCRGDGQYEHYHDEEWGVPVHDERQHFMYLLMESMSCGLSWLMMLQRREVFRSCFAGFDPAKVASFGEDDIQRILATERMIRSRRKVEAMITNARAFLKVAEEFGSFDKYIWSFTNGRSLVYPSHQQQLCTRNALSDRVAADLKRRGFKFVGSTIIYSHLQAIGVINDHTTSCFRYAQLLPHCSIAEEM
jgi:DNA-3-methyladenine glycosylase I